MLDDLFDRIFEMHTPEGREHARLVQLAFARSVCCFVLALVLGYAQPHPLNAVILPAMVIGACALTRLTMPIAVVGLGFLLVLLMLPVGFSL